MALRLAAESTFDLMLTDVVMPQMSGPELAREVHAFAPGLRVLCISGFTGHSALEDLCGAPLLAKPFTADALAAKVKEALERPQAGGVLVSAS